MNMYQHGCEGGSHSLHIGDGKRISLNKCFQQLPYIEHFKNESNYAQIDVSSNCPYIEHFKNESSYVICDVETNGFIKKQLDKIIFYLSWSHWAIFGVEALWGRFRVSFDQCEQGGNVYMFRTEPRWNLLLCKSLAKG